MIVPKELVIEAKEKFGDKAIELIKEHFELENWDDRGLKGSCPFGHSDSSPSFIWNPKNQSFHCFSCGRNFGIIDLYMTDGFTYLQSLEKLFEETGIKFNFGERGVKSKRSYKYPVIECSQDRTKVEKYFETRKISKETLDYCDVGQSKDGNVVWKFYDENDTLLTVKLRPARKIGKQEKIEKEWYLPGYDNTPILFNMNKVDYANGPLVITEGQSDTLAIIEAGYLNVVSVPGGAQNTKWISECYEWLEKFDKIILWSDQDAPGIKMRKEVCSRLGQWRTKYVEIPDEYLAENKEHKDANAILFSYGDQAVLDLIANAQEIPIYGVVDLAEVEEFSIEEASGFYTRIKPLDDTLYKMLFGSVCVVTGARAAGKSSCVNQIFICEPLDQGFDVFLYSAELSTPVIKSWINVTMSGPENITMKNTFVHVINKEAKKKMEDWYKGRIWIYDDKKDNSADSVLDKAISVTRKYGAKVWIIDNLSVLDIGANDNNLYEKQKDLMTKLIGLADLYGVLIVLVAHPRKLQNGMEVSNDDVAGSASLTNLAQYVISVKRFSEREKRGEKDGKGNYKPGKEPIEEDVSINVLKNRYVGFQREIRTNFDFRSRRFFITAKDLNKRYAWDKDNKNPEYQYNPLEAKTPFGD